MKVKEKTTNETSDIRPSSLVLTSEEQLKRKERLEETGIRVDTLLLCNNIPMV